MSDPESNPSAPSAPIKELSGRIGKYDIIKPLGKGAMGMVYLAHDTILERDVALKVMVSSIADDPELKQRFEREAKAVARMTHPNVVNVFDLGSHTDGSPYIAMELLKGQDLQKAVRTPPPMTLERKVNVIVQVLAGLAHAHQAGIVHRDIKPANIFINHDGTVKIMDFGVARLTTASMTGTGNMPEPITETPAGPTLVAGDEPEVGATMQIGPTASGRTAATVKKPGMGKAAAASAPTVTPGQAARPVTRPPLGARPAPAARPLPAPPPSPGH